MIHEHTTPPGSPGGALGRVHENPRPYGEKRLSDAVKEAIPIDKLADDLGAELRRAGKGLRGLCAIHGGRNREAFAVYPEQGRWHCFVCNEGGDVIDLFMRAKGYDDFRAALIDLAGLYGVEAPPRSEGWRRWSVEKGRRRDALREVRARLYQRRLLRFFAEDLAAIEDPGEREEEARKLFAELYPLADAWAGWRSGR